jgi:hypothetical protein
MKVLTILHMKMKKIYIVGDNEMKTKIKHKIKKAYLGTTIALLTVAMSTINVFAGGAGGSGAGGAGAGGAGAGAGAGNNQIGGGPNRAPTQDSEAIFSDLISDIFGWIGWGALIFAAYEAFHLAMAIKEADGPGKKNAILGMIGGFVGFAISQSLDIFGITT